MNRKVIWGVIGVLILLGVGVTVADYRQWRRVETERYGQGWADMRQPALELTWMYQNKPAGIRMRLPTGWKVEEDLRFKDEAPTLQEGEVVMVAQIEKMMKVSVAVTGETTTELVNQEVEKLRASGVSFLAERRSVNTERMDWLMLAWEAELPGGKSETTQKVWGKRGELGGGRCL